MNISDAVLKIVIVHEDPATGIRAATLLNRLMAQSESVFELQNGAWRIDHGFWNFEMLSDPKFRNQAADEAVAADMIIISVGDAGLPASVRDWIETVLPMKAGVPAVLVAMVDRGNDAPGEPPRPEACLRGLAGRYGLDFICNTDNQTPRNASGFEPDTARSEGDTPVWRIH